MMKMSNDNLVTKEDMDAMFDSMDITEAYACQAIACYLHRIADDARGVDGISWGFDVDANPHTADGNDIEDIAIDLMHETEILQQIVEIATSIATDAKKKMYQKIATRKTLNDVMKDLDIEI